MVLLEQSKSCFLNFYSSYRNNIYKVDNTKLKQSTIQEKPEYNKLGFFKLTSVGSHRTDIYCDIRLPRFSITFLIFVLKKQLVLVGVGVGVGVGVILRYMLAPCPTVAFIAQLWMY